MQQARLRYLANALQWVKRMYSGAHKYRSDQEHVRAPTLLRSASLCLSGGPSERSKSTSTPFCVRLHWRRKRL